MKDLEIILYNTAITSDYNGAKEQLIKSGIADRTAECYIDKIKEANEHPLENDSDFHEVSFLYQKAGIGALSRSDAGRIIAHRLGNMGRCLEAAEVCICYDSCGSGEAKTYLKKAGLKKKEIAEKLAEWHIIYWSNDELAKDYLLNAGFKQKRADLKIAELCTKPSTYSDLVGKAIDYSFKTGLSTQKAYSKVIGFLKSNKQYVDASRLYEYLGMHDKADETLLLWVKDIKNGEETHPLCIDMSDEQIRSSTVQEMCLLIAKERINEKAWIDALRFYRAAGCALSKIPHEEQTKLLENVKEGGIEVTQTLAELVKTEEDEIIFNEARAGMVL